MLLPFAFGFINTYRSENWLVRYSPPKLLIKIRSYQNHRLSDDDLVVLEIDTSEVAWVRKLREGDHERRRGRADVRGARVPGVEAQKRGCLGTAETDLRRASAQPQGRKWLHYPVQVSEARTIRVEWRGPSAWITPKAEIAIEMLRSVVEVRAEEMDLRDYTVSPADKAAQEQQILELTERGHHIGAIKLARSRYGYSLKQAKEFVEGLQSPVQQESK